jgi:NifU-like protein involved in Fe-S cluster formation
MITGLSLAQAEALTREDFTEAVGGLPKAKVHCSVLAAAAVRNAVAEWRGRGSG